MTRAKAHRTRLGQAGDALEHGRLLERAVEVGEHRLEERAHPVPTAVAIRAVRGSPVARYERLGLSGCLARKRDAAAPLRLSRVQRTVGQPQEFARALDHV